VRDSAVAEEVTQEVFLNCIDTRLTPDSELLRPWLLRVTLNEARNTIRGRVARWPRYDLSEINR
jgi:DNA-directed RNA polymerase specialized sigma24 family protein